MEILFYVISAVVLLVSIFAYALVAGLVIDAVRRIVSFVRVRIKNASQNREEEK